MPDHAVTSPLAMVNHALALMGEESLTDLLPESGATNAAAKQIYDRIADSMLCEWEWRFATRDLSLSQPVDPPPSPWTAQYNLPPNTLRVVSTDRPGEAFTIASNHDVSDTAGTRRLYARRTGVRARVVVRPLDELFPAHFVAALIPRLAAELAPAVTGDLQLARYFEDKAMLALSKAKVHDANEVPTRRIASSDIDPRGQHSDTRDWFPFLNGSY